MNDLVNKQYINKIINSISKEMNQGSKYYEFGVKYFGPFLYGFTKWLYDSLKKDRCKNVFFFSRDGYMMDKAFSIFNEEENIATKYVYFSRKSIRQSLLHTFNTYKESLKYLTWERYITVGKILEYYGFSEKEREIIAKDKGLMLRDDIAFDNLKNNRIMENLYYVLKDDINEKSIKQEQLLERYIKQIGMIGKCAIVDIGWHGSMQYFLEEFFKKKKEEVKFYGYYVGINPNVPLKGKYYGYLYDKNDSSLRKDVLCFFGGYEKLFQSCEGSTYGYEADNDLIKPILSRYEYKDEKNFIIYIQDWQKGAIDFITIVYKKKIFLKYNRWWAYPLVEFGKNPSKEGIKLFSNFYNTDGTKVYYISQKPIYKYKPLELIHALSNSVWKTGFMKSVFKVPFPYFKIYCLMRK